MAAALDLTGHAFGALTVLRPGEPVRTAGGKAIRRWACLCVCGRELLVRTQHLRGGQVLSCGCRRMEAIRAPRPQTQLDLAGRRFGRLVAVRRLPPPRGQARLVEARWECRCDCGGSATPQVGDLRSGNTRSCGCLRRVGGQQAGG